MRKSGGITIGIGKQFVPVAFFSAAGAANTKMKGNSV